MDNKQTTETDEKVKDTQSITVNELLWLCLARWYWFAIALLITCGYAYYYILKTNKVYVSTAAIMVKDDQTKGNGPEVSETFKDIAGFNTKQNINNEMVQIKSTIIIEEVVKRLGLDVNYTVADGLKDRVLYGSDLPVLVKFLDLGENGRAKVKADFTGNGTLILDDFSRFDGSAESVEKMDLKVNLAKQSGDTLATPLGRIVVEDNPAFLGSKQKQLDITIDRVGVAAAKGRVLSSLATEIKDNYSSVMHITLRDVNQQRANETLETIIEVYNENWIKDRNEKSVSTSEFINDRLVVIEKELGSVDSDISDYKSSQRITDVGAVSSAYLERSLSAADEVARLNTTLSHARQVRDHLSNVANSNVVLPASTGLQNISIEGLIADYNMALITRNNLIANSSEENPVVERIDVELAGKRQAILTAIDSYITTRNAEIRGSQ